MNREILFRGKTAKWNDWIIGLLSGIPTDRTSYRTDLAFITNDNGDEIAVLPETVGQYTGLTDKNGNRIFEGDILESDIISTSGNKYVDFYKGDFITRTVDNKIYSGLNLLLNGNSLKWEIIGNIHDNPELLEDGCEK